MRRPIEIVGGGLAGLSLGLALQRAGISVTIFETGEYPRHRVCGEFIAGLAGSTIQRLGLAPFLTDALRHREIAWYTTPDKPRMHLLPSPAYGLSRFVLDARIAQAFEEAGGQLRTGTRLVELKPRDGLVFATGRRAATSPWIGLKIHVSGLALARPLEIHLGDEAYVGLSKIENGMLNLCGLFKRRRLSAPGAELITAYLEAAQLKTLAARVRSAHIDPGSFCAVAAINFDRKVPSQDSVRLGDACAMVPPFTGNGMAMAFQSAETALDPLLSYACGEFDWNKTCAVIHRKLLNRFRVRLASAHLLHPYLFQRRKQRWLALADRARILPFRPIYAALH